jgi:hypothetical protein
MALMQRMSRRASRLGFQIEMPGRNFYALFASLGDVRLNFLKSIGRDSRKMLQREFLSGPTSINRLTYDGLYKDSRGAYKVKNRILKGTKRIVLTSFPLNFFEHGRHYKSGYVDPPRRILKTKAKAKLEGGRLQRFADKALNAIVRAAFEQAGR